MIHIQRSGLTAVAVTLVLHAASLNPTQASSKTYDMSRFLNEPHPFTVSAEARERPLPIKSSHQDQKSPIYSKTVTPGSAVQHSSALTAKLQNEKFSDGLLSEIRIGALKHAVSLIGNKTKETGMDGNIELLFQTPAWLEFLWSPRPMIGASANGSSTNTDIAYTGLTWEWNPWSDLILDFSFGFASHNGKLRYDATQVFPEDAGRHREFGCRWLFRETLEAGWLFANQHAATLMWSHYSHGGLCDDKNEGLDNVGIRYGYRF